MFANGSVIALTPNHLFEENREFYINFDRGGVIGIEGCRPGNEPVTGRQFWTFKTNPSETPGKECILIGAPVYVIKKLYRHIY